MSDYSFTQRVLNIHQSGLQRCRLVVTWLVPRETYCCRLGARSVYTIQGTSLHFWHNGLNLLHATALTRGWNGYRNKSQHRKFTLEKIENLPAAPAGTRTRDLSITSPALDHCSGLSPLPLKTWIKSCAIVLVGIAGLTEDGTSRLIREHVVP